MIILHRKKQNTNISKEYFLYIWFTLVIITSSIFFNSLTKDILWFNTIDKVKKLYINIYKYIYDIVSFSRSFSSLNIVLKFRFN